MKVKYDVEKNNELKSVVNIITDLRNGDTRIKFGKDGVNISCTDTANVAMIDYLQKPSNFTEYTVGEGESVTINIQELRKVLARMNTGTITFSTSQAKLIIENHGKTYKQFELPLMDDGGEPDKKPNLAYGDNKLTLNTNEFAEGIEDVKIAEEAVLFAVKNNKFTLEAKGKMSVNVETKSVGIATDSKAKYSTEYLEKMITSITKEVNLYFKTDYPMTLEYIGQASELRMVLAPRIENN